MTLLLFISWFVLLVISIPIVFFCIEVFVGLRKPKALDSSLLNSNARVSSVIVIPAHNEALVIGKTLSALKKEIDPALDRILVVADNCNDETASIVKAQNVAVIERTNEKERGKGFALEFALNFLRDQSDQPQIVVIFDADCHFKANTFQTLKSICFQENRPVQAAYRLLAPKGAGVSTRVAEFAIRVKNVVRNRGLTAIGFPAVLTGTGMAFPFNAFEQVKLASSELAEDMKLGVDMTLAGFPANYTDHAEVLSELPQAAEATSTQRERWEHGHLTVMKKYMPSVFKQSIQQKNITLFGTFLDLTIPPLSLLVLVSLLATFAVSTVGVIGGNTALIIVSLCLVLLLVLTVLIAWWHHGRDLLSAHDLLTLPLFILSKVGVYRKFASGPQTAWVRTKRDGEDK